MIRNIFFDLDSTLLQMNQDEFLSIYLKALAKKCQQEINYDPKQFINDLMSATNTMLENDGKNTNESVFWKSFTTEENRSSMEKIFTEFYENEFRDIKQIVNYNPLSKSIVSLAKEKGFKVILATNPIFPLVATKERMSWAGLDENMFDYITTYENSSFSKPKNDYYLEICLKLNLDPKECLMVGNDMGDDFKFIDADFSKYLVTDYLINTENKPIEMQNGTLKELFSYISNMI